MLTIKKPVDTPCFATNSKENCYLVSFRDGSFTGVLCFQALLDALKRKTAQMEVEKTPPTQKVEKTPPSTPPKA